MRDYVHGGQSTLIINVQSEYWGGEVGVDIEIDDKLNQQQQTEFELDGENWRTETFAWIK